MTTAIKQTEPYQIQINIDLNHRYATIRVDGLPRYWLEQEGCCFCLRTGNEFDTPVRRWRSTARRNRIEVVLPEALAVVLALQSPA